ncbi:MAG: glycosyltransferase family 1 protein, partial [Candidatus Sericytochromatia bacterium]|nr:glycosyltransferase family 1 protein [Candidatus Sericytochromatia bacterium]
VSAAVQPLRPVIAYCGSPKYRNEKQLGWRVHVIRHLLASGLPLELHHDDWATVPGCEAAARPTPTLTAWFGTFRTATVNLALAADWDIGPHPLVKLLNVEIAAAGGMQIAQPSAELADLFSFDRDIATADTAAEIAMLSRHFLSTRKKPVNWAGIAARRWNAPTAGISGGRMSPTIWPPRAFTCRGSVRHRPLIP